MADSRPAAVAPPAAPPTTGGPLLPAFAALAWLAVLAVFVLVVPVMNELFRDMDVALPVATIAVLRFGGWLRGSSPGTPLPGVLVPGVVLAALAGGFAATLTDHRAVAKSIFVVLLALALMVLLGVTAALAVPLLALQESPRSGGV